MVRARTDRGSRRRSVVLRLRRPAYGLSVPRRHVRAARGGRSSRPGPALREPGVSFRPVGLGLQFHIEMTEAMVHEWLDEPDSRRLCAALDYIDPDAVRAETPEALPKMRVLADRVLPRFAALCRGGGAQDRSRMAPRVARP